MAKLKSGTTIGGSTAWHASNDGSGSGLDADLLDGIQGSSLLRSDANDIYSGGVLQISSDSGIDVTNTGQINGLQVYQPTAGNDALMSFHVSNDYAIHFGLSGDDNQLVVGGWSLGAVKYKVWHAGNDGSGSGLDADTLDGNQATAFAAASHSHDYVPERNRTDWNDSTVINNVIGQLAWKNYGNNHTIFDASAGTTPDGTAKNNTNPDVAWGATYPTLMGWNGSNTYGVRVDRSRYSEAWANARTNTVTLTGDVTGSGSASVDGSGNWTVTVATTGGGGGGGITTGKAIAMAMVFG